eukprot:TRINITY_DN1279_c0_g1_i5.p2 TRINITY_DN1279_c0_g1~~TRINITY_DN1279_c0_g1_i5.p2  ORF type:complete len:107 (+),score=12.83 TRINITY_DN1279_c0_g1_i5:35-322(+)
MAEPVAAGAAPTLTPPEGGAVAALPSGSPAPAAAGDAPRKTKHLEDFELGRVLGQGSFGAVRATYTLSFSLHPSTNLSTKTGPLLAPRFEKKNTF